MLELVGEADLATEALLGLELAQLAARASREAVVDVTRLSFCDVASGHMIMTAQRWGPVTVVGARGSVKRVFELLDQLQARRLPRYLA